MIEIPEDIKRKYIILLPMAIWREEQLRYSAAYNIYIKADDAAIEAYITYLDYPDTITLKAYEDARLTVDKANVQVDITQEAMEYAYSVVQQSNKGSTLNKVR